MTKTTNQALKPPEVAKVKIIPGGGSGVANDSQKDNNTALTAGIVTTVDPTRLPPNVFSDTRNSRFRYDKTERRAGKERLIPTQPDALSVLKLIQIRNSVDGSNAFMRFTNSSLYRRRNEEWLEILPAAGSSSFAADITDKFSAAVLFDQLVFTNGQSRLHLYDPDLSTYSNLSPDAPQSQFVAGFYNRVIAVRRTDGSNKGPITIDWSAMFPALDIWNNSDNDEAGTDYLIQSPAEASDFCTGVVGFTNVLVLTKEKSIWCATKQPIASNPFNFYNAVPGIGCDCSYSIAVIPNGIIFVDKRSQGVYIFTVDGNIERIGGNVDKTLTSRIEDVNEVFGSYDSTNGEYRVNVGDGILDYVYNFGNKAWSIDDGDFLGTKKTSFYYSEDIFHVGLVIDQLTGVIDDLVGVIDDLSDPIITDDRKMYIGYENGDIQVENEDLYEDLGNDFTVSWNSKLYHNNKYDTTVKRITFDLNIVIQPITLLLYYSNDGGTTWNLIKTVNSIATGNNLILKSEPNVSGPKMMVKLEAIGGQIELIGYNCHTGLGGESITI